MTRWVSQVYDPTMLRLSEAIFWPNERIKWKQNKDAEKKSLLNLIEDEKKFSSFQLVSKKKLQI